MADDMIGTLFESDATSLLDGEASHLLTQLESMAPEPSQPHPSTLQQQYYDFGSTSGSLSQMQSPQAIQSPVGSLHSPGSMISPPAPQHYNSPSPQQSSGIQRQLSGTHQYSSYPTHSMQQVPSSPNPSAGSSAMWRQPQPGYQHPTQTSQMWPPSGSMVPQAMHIPTGQQGSGQQAQYVSHPTNAHIMNPKAQHMSQQSPDMYGHVQQMQYQTPPAGYMQASALSQQQMSSASMMSNQPRMPRPGMSPYAGQMMHPQRVPVPQMEMSRQPMPMGPPQQHMLPASNPTAVHPQQMHGYRQSHYAQMTPVGRDMMGHGPYSAMNQMHPQSPHANASYGYAPPHMMSPRSSQPSYPVPHSSQPYQSAIPPHQNGSSLEQLEKMVVPMSQNAPNTSISAQQYQHVQSPELGVMSPRGQQTIAPQPPPNVSVSMRPSGSHMVPQQRTMHSNNMSGPVASVHVHPQNMGGALQTIGKEIEVLEHNIRQLRNVPPPFTPEHEKDLRISEERLRSLNSQKSMMLADLEQAQKKEAEKSHEHAASPSSISVKSKELNSTPDGRSPEKMDILTQNKEENADTHQSDELTTALSVIEDGDSKMVSRMEKFQDTNNVQVPYDSQSSNSAVADNSNVPNNTSTSDNSSKSEPKPKKTKTKKSSKKGQQQQVPPPLPHGQHMQQAMHPQAQYPMAGIMMSMQGHPGMPGDMSAQMQPGMPVNMPPQMQGVQSLPPHHGMQGQPIMFIQQGHPMMHQQSSTSNMPGQPMAGQIIISPHNSGMQYPQGMPSPASHRMTAQQSMQRSLPPQPPGQLRAIAPRPNPQNSIGQMQQAQVIAQMPMHVNGPVSSLVTQTGVNVHLPELLEDPEMRGLGFPESVSDIPSTVDSPAFSDSSIGKSKKAKSKGSFKKGRKSGPKKPPASLLKLKKRKRKDSESMSEPELSPNSALAADANADFIHRRSGRVTKKQKYVDDLDLDITDDDESNKDKENLTSGIVMEDVKEEAPVVNQYIVEKIMGVRDGTRENVPDDADATTDQSDSGIKEEDKPKRDVNIMKVSEYFVKYKNFSYLHCDWKTQEELEVFDKRASQKIKRWQQKQALSNAYMMNMLDEDELFNPEYVEVERVLAESHISPPEGSDEPESVYFLVKWRSLPYEDATWELEQDVDKTAIEHFKQYSNAPKKRDRMSAPTPDQWKALSQRKEYKSNNQLREYQFEGVNWLTFCYYNRQNCILADEMGLGKTVQSIAFLQTVFDYGIPGPFLVIAPLSTIGNWIREFDAWTDQNVIVYHGSSVSRAMLQEYEMFYKNDAGQRRFDVFKFHSIITTYEVIIQDVELLAQIEWRCCVIDEAHRLKNKNCKLIEGLRCFDIEHKVLLSGTPLQNNVEELFSLLHFLEPARFKSSSEFLAEFGNLKTESQVERLKAILKPMMLRRLKEDVEKNLAPKEETIIEVELTNIQKKYYRAILEKNFSFLSKGGTSANVPNLMNTMMELRKCCNHPYLIDGAEEQIILDIKDKKHATDADILTDAMVQSSGKLVLLDKLLPKLKAGNHKVLIFSQMIRVLDILEDYLIHRKYIYERIDGRIRGNQRQEAIDRFSKPESDRFVFLLCTRAGGLGINLTAADTCIIYDSDWNPQNDLQAQARCHRIGQQKAVKVYRLICRNTYEREMFDKASLKLGLDKAVLQSMGSSGKGGEQGGGNAAAPLSKQEIEQLLKKGAYGALMEDDQSGDRFCEEDIDQILQRRTQVITIEAVGKGSTFAKASFSSAGARDDIDINDPEFWQKWAKKADLEVNNDKNELIIAEPRQRKQTKRYGGHGADRLDDLSDLGSSSDTDEDDKKNKPSRGGRRSKKKDEDFEFDDNVPPPGCYARPECFKVEKLLLVYGWGRWADIVKHGRFRRPLDELDVSNISQAILLYSIQHYKGDTTIKRFIWDLIMPSEDGKIKDIKNHQGLAAPTPRGRKPKNRSKKEEDEDFMDRSSTKDDGEAASLDEKIMSCPVDAESVLSDAGYRKHLSKHSNKVLLRVRMLYYIKQEIIGSQSSNVMENLPWSKVDILSVPKCEGEPPTTWWDRDSDKCLLVGVFKHGYEKYNLIRADNSLLFLSLCGPPDNQALRKEQQDDDEDPDKMDDIINEDSPAPPVDTSNTTSGDSKTNLLPFPTSSDLNTRLRRLVTAYQKTSRKRQEEATAAAERRSSRLDRLTSVLRVKEIEKIDRRCKWTRREEADFYRVASSFGVELMPRKASDEPRQYKWDTFKQLANLHKKDDKMLTEYMDAFVYMCKRVCNRLSPSEEAYLPSLMIEPVSEERASRCLMRIELLNKIREEILWHDQLTKRLMLCQFSPEIPHWWKPGEHDKDLIIGAAKHGLAHTDQHILYDPKLCFKDLMLKSLTEPDRPKVKQESHELKPSQKQEVAKKGSESPEKEEYKEALTNGIMEHGESSCNVSEKNEAIKSEKTAKADGSDTKTNGFSSSENSSLSFYWPKDRVLHQRLELVCYCIETGEWPTAAVAKKLCQLAATSHLDTPTASPSVSRTATPNLSEYSCAIDDDDVDSLKLTISRGSGRGRKPKRSRLDLEVDRIARLRDGADSECSQSTPLRSTPESYLNGLSTEDVLSSFIRPRKKRGRKSKAEKEAESRAAAEAAVAASYQRVASLDIDSDVRIPMINLEDGSRVTGDDAPMRKDLESWMLEHPKYMVDITDNLGSSSSSSQGALANMTGSNEKRGRKPKIETSSEVPDLASLTGAENVPVIHRESGKKILGSKAPTLLQLSQWLEKNTSYDVDQSWGSLAKNILPEHLHNRIYSEKRKKKREIDASQSFASLAAQQAAAAQALLAASMQYPMNMAAFNSLAALGMPSASMMSLYGLGLGADPSHDEETLKALTAAAGSTHSAFPFSMYNPMLMYSSLLAQSLGISSPQSYAQAMASAGMLNGMLGLDPSSFTGEMDAETAEKFAALASSMNQASGMNLHEDLQIRSKMLEEFYGQAISAAGRGSNTSHSSSKEPGERSSPSRSHHKKAATATKPADMDNEKDEAPEDLTVKSKPEIETPSQAEAPSNSSSDNKEKSDTKFDTIAEERTKKIYHDATSSEDRKRKSNTPQTSEQTNCVSKNQLENSPEHQTVVHDNAS